MSNDCKYYFAFRKGHELYGFYVEVIGTYSQKVAMGVFYKRYGIRSWGINPSVLKFHPKGCYEKIYLPLPENVEIELDDPFSNTFSNKNKYDIQWAIIGMNKVGKSGVDLGKLPEKNKIIILDDYRKLI